MVGWWLGWQHRWECRVVVGPKRQRTGRTPGRFARSGVGQRIWEAGLVFGEAAFHLDLVLDGVAVGVKFLGDAAEEDGGAWFHERCYDSSRLIRGEYDGKT